MCSLLLKESFKIKLSVVLKRFQYMYDSHLSVFFLKRIIYLAIINHGTMNISDGLTSCTGLNCIVKPFKLLFLEQECLMIDM